jgi:hypothetical protein
MIEIDFYSLTTVPIHEHPNLNSIYPQISTRPCFPITPCRHHLCGVPTLPLHH